MNDVQINLTYLLQEIDAAFTKWNIPYSLGERLAWDAMKFGKFHDATYDAVIFARRFDRYRIKRALKMIRSSDRATYIRDNGVDNYVEYVNESSTLIDLNTGKLDAAPGIKVIIKLARFDFMKNTGYLKSSNTDRIYLPNKFFDSPHKVTFENHDYSISQYIGPYFDQIVGNNWQMLKWPYAINRIRFGVVHSTLLPYSVFLEAAHTKNLIDNDAIKLWPIFNNWYEDEYRKKEKVVSKNNKVLGYHQERWRLWGKYAPMKKQLLNHFDSGYDLAVEIALEDYLTTLVRYYKQTNTTICFDVELFELATKILEKRGVITREKLLTRIPEGHYSNIIQPSKLI